MSRTIIVTGGGSGVGAAAARAFAADGARVVLAVRNLEGGHAAAAAMPGAVEVRHLDLADLGSVRRFAAGWQEPVDVLLNNAGVMGVPFSTTVDGIESTFAINHLGHFALTQWLLPQVRDRVVTVSSLAHWFGRIDTTTLDDLNYRQRQYRPMAAYAASKLANLLFAYELARRLVTSGSTVRSIAVHPGLTQSRLWRWAAPTLLNRVVHLAHAALAQSTDQGGRSLTYAALADIGTGSFVGPGGLGQARGGPTLVDSSAMSRNMTLAGLLWARSAETVAQ